MSEREQVTPVGRQDCVVMMTLMPTSRAASCFSRCLSSMMAALIRACMFANEIFMHGFLQVVTRASRCDDSVEAIITTALMAK